MIEEEYKRAIVLDKYWEQLRVEEKDENIGGRRKQTKDWIKCNKSSTIIEIENTTIVRAKKYNIYRNFKLEQREQEIDFGTQTIENIYYDSTS